jgi:hypothetical protein
LEFIHKRASSNENVESISKWVSIYFRVWQGQVPPGGKHRGASATVINSVASGTSLALTVPIVTMSSSPRKKKAPRAMRAVFGMGGLLLHARFS